MSYDDDPQATEEGKATGKAVPGTTKRGELVQLLLTRARPQKA